MSYLSCVNPIAHLFGVVRIEVKATGFNKRSMPRKWLFDSKEVKLTEQYLII